MSGIPLEPALSAARERVAAFLEPPTAGGVVVSGGYLPRGSFNHYADAPGFEARAHLTLP